MPDMPELSEAKRALLEKYLRGTVPQAARVIEPKQEQPESPPVLESAKDTSTDASLVPVVTLRSTGSKRPFFYSHVHVDGGAFYCFTLAERLGPDQPFYILEPHRFDNGQIPTSLEEMATEYIKAMRAVQPEGPYLLGGFCGGGLIVFEMAHQLREQGQDIDLLLLVEPVDGPGPSSYRRLLRESSGRFVRRISYVLPLSWQQQLDWFLRARHYYVLLRYPAYRKAQKHWLKPALEMLHRDWIGIFVWLISDYKPVKYPGKVTYIWAKEEFISHREWGKKQAEAVQREIHMMPGDHWSCRNTYLEAYADCLNQCVSEAQETQVHQQ